MYSRRRQLVGLVGLEAVLKRGPNLFSAALLAHMVNTPWLLFQTILPTSALSSMASMRRGSIHSVSYQESYPERHLEK